MRYPGSGSLRVEWFRRFGFMERGKVGLSRLRTQLMGKGRLCSQGFRNSGGFGRSFCQQAEDLALQASAKFRRSIVMV